MTTVPSLVDHTLVDFTWFAVALAASRTLEPYAPDAEAARDDGFVAAALMAEAIPFAAHHEFPLPRLPWPP